MGTTLTFLAVVALAALSSAWARVVDFAAAGGVANDPALSTCWHNSILMNKTFAALQSGDTLLFPNTTFWLMGGIYAGGLSHVTLQFEGTLVFSDNETAWPRYPGGAVFECFYMERLNNVTFTSTHQGLIDGNGRRWWGLVKYVLIGENRPRLLHVYNSTNLLVEKLFFKNSPYWTTWFEDIRDLEIRYSVVDARVDNKTYHPLSDIAAFNTDGFDVAGANVWIHDCTIWNDDDCIAVKESNGDSYQSKCSENMLFERINASGVGLTIGSIGANVAHTCVRNITFRNCVMPNSFKGLYLKSRPEPEGDGEISDILYENITINSATQWAIWIGPQQASYQGACNLFWPFVPGVECDVPSNMDWNNLTFRNITVNSPWLSPGVIIGNETNPMQNIVFDGVVVNNPGKFPWGNAYYDCQGVKGGVASGGTDPIPPCFSSSIP